jgi:hypothetical protein
LARKKSRFVNLGKQFKEGLLKKYFVRWHMSLILAATIASGILIDKLFLHLGFGLMGWRYALSVLGAYGLFFCFVRLWVWYAAGIAPRVDLPDLDGVEAAPDALNLVPGPPSHPAGLPEFASFRGGDAGGGGASDLFDSLPDTGGSGIGNIDLNIDLEDGWWILLILAILVAVLCGAGIYLIWMAPEILPEVALEAAIGAGMVKVLKEPQKGWAGRLLHRTWVPLVIVLCCAYAAGYFIQKTCPGATHVRQALACAVTTQ